MADLIHDYCRLLTRDPEACAALFDPAATLTTFFGSVPGTIEGQAAIRELLVKAPSEVTFEVVSDAPSEHGRTACLRISDRTGLLAHQLVHYSSDADRFVQFTVIPEGNPETGSDDPELPLEF